MTCGCHGGDGPEVPITGMDAIDSAQQAALDRNEVVDAAQSRKLDWLTLWLLIFAAVSAMGSFFQAWEAYIIWARLK